ncbi:hypothetical protein B0H11DRAFT_1970649 [Mycena galericulata]|nr:hypothetical protein B0H11DRAFT_1970649 [Mycena galericulata]
MKRSRDKADSGSTRAGTKKQKSIQACASCRKHKTRCEILDPSRSPVKCHQCQALARPCSYEETILPTASTSKLPDSTSPVENSGSQKPSAGVTKPPPLPPTDRLWSFVSEENSGIDWQAPMLAIQQLSKLPTAHSNVAPQPLPPLPPGDFTLHQILSEERIRYLLDFGPLLDTVCCAVASRHLDNAAGGAVVKMQLQKLAEDLIAKMIFNPRPSESVEAIEALLILSLWAPLGGPPEKEGRDGRLLIASAVSMAMNLRLNQASSKALALRKLNGGRLSLEDTEALEETLENARLWIALTNTESMLCLGTGRVSLSRRSPEDLELIVFPERFDDSVDYGDLRLNLTAQAFSLLEEGVGSRLTVGVDVDSWYDRIMIVLEKMKRAKRLLVPLPYVLEHDQFYFHVLHVYQEMARLLVVYHALWEARVSVGEIPRGQIWHPYFKPHGVETVGEWGRDMIQTAETLLVYVLAADARLLSTAPDNVFTMVALAAGYVVAVKFLMLRGGSVLLGASDLLLAKTITHLNGVACTPGHAAQRAAFLVKGMAAKWEGRGKPAPPVASYPTPTSDRQPDNPPAPSASTPNSDFFEASTFLGQQDGSLPEIDFSMFMDSSIPIDAEFWNSLAQTQLLPGYQ